MSIKLFLPVVLLGFCAHTLRADSYTVSLKTGAANDLLITTPIAGGYQFTYENLTTGAAIGIPPTVSVSDSTFTATYVVTGGVGVLNVTDVCAKVNVLTPLAPCQQFAFSFTDASFANATVISALVGTNVLVTANTANFALAGGSIALGGGEVHFTNPPPPTAVTPEPSSIIMVGSGLLAAAGALRRRMAP